MKKLILFILICGCLVVGQPIIDPKPEPIEVKPILISEQKQWDLTKAYYRKVRMPDGSKQELKSRTALTDTQWLELAEKVYVKPEPMPEPCSHCGGTGIEP